MYRSLIAPEESLFQALFFFGGVAGGAQVSFQICNTKELVKRVTERKKKCVRHGQRGLPSFSFVGFGYDEGHI